MRLQTWAFDCFSSNPGKSPSIEAHLLWMNGDRFCLTSFERKQVDGNIVDFAQSWICALGEQKYDPDHKGLMPPPGQLSAIGGTMFQLGQVLIYCPAAARKPKHVAHAACGKSA